MKVKVMSNNYASDKQVLRNAFPKWAEGEGIFSEMTEMPWNEEVDGVTLDMEYFGNRSGLKFCSPLVYNFLDKDGSVTSDGRAAIARVLKSRFLKPWKRLWDTYTAEYDPLENYQMQEDETRNLKGVNAFTDDTTGNETLSNTDETNGTDTITRTGTVDSTRTEQSNDGGTTEGSETLKTQNQRNGFNSIAPVDTSNVGTTNNTTGETTATHSGNSTDKVTNDLQDKNVRSDTVTSNGSRDTTKNLSHSGNSSEDETITRKTHGFNGHLYTYQRLLSQERELWMWDYFEKVFQDVDRVLSLAIFDPCRVQSTGLYSGGAANQYVLPVANNSTLGGVRGPSKTNGMIPVQIDGSGRMFVPDYLLPIAASNKLGGVKAATKSNATIPVQVDSDGTLYVPEGGIKEVPLATSESVGGIQFPAEPTGDGEEISTKNGVQYKVDGSLNPDGGAANDKTASVVIPFATERAGLVKAVAKTTESQAVAVDTTGKLWVPTSSGGGAVSREVVNTGEATATVTTDGLEFNGQQAFHLVGNEGKTIKFVYEECTYYLDVDKVSDFYIGYNCRQINPFGGISPINFIATYSVSLAKQLVMAIPVFPLNRLVNKRISVDGYCDVRPTWSPMEIMPGIVMSIGAVLISDGEYLFDSEGLVYARSGDVSDIAKLTRSVDGNAIKYSKPAS